MKHIGKLLGTCALWLTSTFALATPSLDQIISGAPAISESGFESFSVTDTDGVTDSAFAQIVLELASFESAFGLYEFEVDNLGNVTVTDQLQIFAGSDEPSLFGGITVQFHLLEGIAFIDDDGTVGYSAGDTQAQIDGTFGLYTHVENTGHTWYSHSSLNRDGFDHLLTFDTLGAGGVTNNVNMILAWEDLMNGGDQDFQDMVVAVNDIVGVAEPGSLLMLGIGLVGLGFARRRQSQK